MSAKHSRSSSRESERVIIIMSSLAVSEVKAGTAYASKSMPALDLEADLNFDYRVYVVECKAPAGDTGPYYYLGIEHKSVIGRRLMQQFDLKGGYFTKQHPPKALHLVWPAAIRL